MRRAVRTMVGALRRVGRRLADQFFRLAPHLVILAPYWPPPSDGDGRAGTDGSDGDGRAGTDGDAGSRGSAGSRGGTHGSGGTSGIGGHGAPEPRGPLAGPAPGHPERVPPPGRLSARERRLWADLSAPD
ncbi:DUF6059 family protein [Plantactinospora sp. KBS50]|uniref:DUF6059 family protein n=1 Tax=Plantactinospora sp. KBS50 TaxID=2024580 RepID=UPI0018DF2AA4|nr:DUF6059 family protein [Plantactinospora sp. KBS50]